MKKKSPITPFIVTRPLHRKRHFFLKCGLTRLYRYDHLAVHNLIHFGFQITDFLFLTLFQALFEISLLSQRFGKESHQSVEKLLDKTHTIPFLLLDTVTFDPHFNIL